MARLPNLEKHTQLLVHPSQLSPYQRIFIYGSGKMGRFVEHLLRTAGLDAQLGGFLSSHSDSSGQSICIDEFLASYPQQNTAIVIASSFTDEILPLLFEGYTSQLQADIWLGNHLYQDAHYIADKEVKEFILQHSSIDVPWGASLDIGANVGKYTTLLSLFSSEVHAFEPDPENLVILEARAKRLPAEVTVNAVGVADQPGVLTLYKDQFTAEATSTTFDPAISSSWEAEQFTALQLPVTSLDTYCNAHKIEPSLIKIDAEGLDLAVLKGAEDLLLSLAPLVVFENNPDHIHNYPALLHKLAARFRLISLANQEEVDDWCVLEHHPREGSTLSYNYALVAR